LAGDRAAGVKVLSDGGRTPTMTRFKTQPVIAPPRNWDRERIP
jgi:hypothetical protein